MIIYILHNDRYFTFRLPKNVEGNFVLYDYDRESFKRNLVNINGEDSKWIAKSNSSSKIYVNNEYVDQTELVLYNYYLISTSYNENVYLYVTPGNDTNFSVKKFLADGKITVGSDYACDIVLADSSVSPKQFELELLGSTIKYTTLAQSAFLYVSGRKVSDKLLDDFDIIFLNGIKFLIFSNMIFISSPNTVVQFGQVNLGDINPEYVIGNIDTSAATYSDFYDSSAYFSKSPVFRKKINTLDLTITGPENKQKSNGDTGSFIMSIVPSALMSVTTLMSAYSSVKGYASGMTNKDTFVTTIISTALMLFMTLAWPFINRFAESIHNVLSNMDRNIKYKKYLKMKRNILESAKNEQKMTLQFNNLSIQECQDTIFKKTANLFSISPEQKRFLTVKLGVGKVLLDCNIQYEKPDFIKEKDKLLDDIDKLIDNYKYIDDAPYSFSLTNNVAFIYGNKNYENYLSSIVLQLITLQDYYNLKLVLFTNENTFLSRIRNLSYCWENDRSMRFYASNVQEADNLSSYLIRIFNDRLSNSNNTDNDNSMIPHYLIICDNMDMYRNVSIIDRVLHQKDKKTGFSFVAFAPKITDVPDCCSYFVDFQNEQSTLFQSEMDESNIMSFNPEVRVPGINMDACISLIANIPIKSSLDVNNGNGNLPDKLGFLELNNVGKVEHLNSGNRWKTSQIVNSLGAPIGVDANGNTLLLDLHEKAHGPHGLIAGMTGSGKSEFIVTYILSLAVNYSPDEVQFVLIDYKGGGLAGAFENRKTGIKLPHLVGTITNLDKSSMNRTLVSIKSELERRQHVFNTAKEQLDIGSIDIYKYQKLVREGSLTDPMSHLFIICDEFAELKAQQPDFMDELVSAARIGRSLGIHLILATQKPSGVVDEQIWSNSKFKVCCKVQTAEDSNEMIRKPDAAFIKESGRFYLQVGYDEIFVKGQSAYTGTQYVPSDTIVSNDNVMSDIEFVDNLGNVTNSIKMTKENKVTTNTDDLGEELTNITKYLIDVAAELGYKNHQLWLDNVPEILPYNSLISKYGIKSQLYNIEPIIGEYDDPSSQNQGVVTLPITTGGNTYIVGYSGSGKQTLLSTIIYSTIINHNSDEVNFYIVDCGMEKLKKFADAPQVGDVITLQDSKQIGFLFHMLKMEQYKRQKYYSESGSSFENDVKNKKSPFPNIIVIIYDVDAFKETYADMFDESIIPFTRNCSKYGINFIATGTGISSLGYYGGQYFPQKIVLNLQDQSDVSAYFEHPPMINKNPGRGLVAIDEVPYEFQVSLVFNADEEVSNLRFVIDQLNKHLKTKAKPIPSIPAEVTIEDLKPNISNLLSVPLGINLITAQLEYYNFNELFTVILSARQQTFVKYLYGLQQLLLSIENTKIIILDALENADVNVVDDVKYYNSGFTKVLPVIKSNIEKYNSSEEKSDSKFIIIVLNNCRLSEHIEQTKAENPDTPSIYELINLASKNDNFKFILYDLADNCNELRDGDMANIYDCTRGLWVGRKFESQSLFETSYISGDILVEDDTVIKVERNNLTVLKSLK